MFYASDKLTNVFNWTIEQFLFLFYFLLYNFFLIVHFFSFLQQLTAGEKYKVAGDSAGRGAFWQPWVSPPNDVWETSAKIP